MASPFWPSSRERHVSREDGASALLREIESDGPKYKRFGNVVDLRREVRGSLVQVLESRFGLSPRSDENQVAKQMIAATSVFESRPPTKSDQRISRHPSGCLVSLSFGNVGLMRMRIVTNRSRQPHLPCELFAASGHVDVTGCGRASPFHVGRHATSIVTWVRCSSAGILRL